MILVRQVGNRATVAIARSAALRARLERLQITDVIFIDDPCELHFVALCDSELARSPRRPARLPRGRRCLALGRGGGRTRPRKRREHCCARQAKEP
eukprot:3717595-Pleurochrysis_carterae.AAC.3